MFKLVLPLQEFLVFFKTRVVLYTCSQRVLVSDATQIPSSEIEGITPIINQLLSGSKVSFYHLWLGLPHHSLNTALRLGADLCFSCLIFLSLFPLSEFWPVVLWMLGAAELPLQAPRLFQCWLQEGSIFSFKRKSTLTTIIR